ncbi:ATP-binding cassette sub-family G member 1-like isoform X2 [Phymastichus coffea]|uniref:ATP-binding cassette sub-family G member 1-like isoform X2 n=1 Tax=Phymastichus coffea TaxID=108790 RepID=UPI00273B4BA6|nr:ATP-binding cassette sub-family G member 1-like isoform X2 [Phymastichus coffea]
MRSERPIGAATRSANQFTVSFNDISYSVRRRPFYGEWKKLLSDICGDFHSGELTAIMGPSGAGKSTLMDILTGFTTSGWRGEVLVNGRKRNLASFRRLSAYIMQDDHMQPLLTVAESMWLAADLKLEFNKSATEKWLDTILKEMGLDNCANTRANDLSGGQKKRLAIALELISNPPIMFFDEPTSGLDSVAARQCLGLLKSLAREGRTIVCSIHQPSASLFDMIDHLYVMDKGHCIYTGSARNLVSFLMSFNLQCPAYYDPADFLLEVVNGDYGHEHLDQLINSSDRGKCKRWHDDGGSCSDSSSNDQSSKMRCVEYLPKLPLSATPIIYESQTSWASSAYYATGFFWQLRVLLRRNAIKLSRDKILSFTRLTMHLLIGLLVGSMYYQIGQDAAFALENFSLLFFTLMFVMYTAFSATLITFPDELPILTREHFNRWYKLRSVYIANKLADLPVQIAATACFTFVVYQMSGQISELRRLALFALMCLMVSLIAQIIGLIIGISLSVQNGVVFGPFAITPSLIFSGFFVYLRDAPSYIQWIFHVSFLKYGFEGVVLAIYGYGRPKMGCSADYCHFRLPEVLLDMVNMKYSSYWTSTIFMIGLYIVLDVTAYLLLRVRLKNRTYII